jgi:hypothetical protein
MYRMVDYGVLVSVPLVLLVIGFVVATGTTVYILDSFIDLSATGFVTERFYVAHFTKSSIRIKGRHILY